MDLIPSTLETLKNILANLGSPEQLDDHPWTRSLLARARSHRTGESASPNPGKDLLSALAELFCELQPPTPPVQGKRLDTRWGRFGLLGAYYFVPLLFGRLQPRSLREAWRRIDSAILLLVFGDERSPIDPEISQPYRLLAGEADLPANSTISDWHREGLSELANLLLAREQYLSQSSGQPSPLLEPEVNPVHRRPKIKPWRALQPLPGKLLAALAGLLLVGGALLGVSKARQALESAQALQADLQALQALKPTSFDPEVVEQAGRLLEQTRADLEDLQAQATPWLGVSSRLGWLPVYGGDLAQAADLLTLAEASLDAVELTYESAYPIWQAVYAEETDLKATEITAMFLETRPALLAAQVRLQEAQAVRAGIREGQLSERTRGLLTKIDPYLSLLDEGLSVSLALPGLLGAAEDGPKTYLILIQNEDELRPTGGFIGGVGTVVVFEGKPVSWNVADSYSVDDPEKLYPPAPWQLRSFMNLPLMTFHDSNWFSDYPQAALWAEYLYAITNQNSVDGVIAIDQQVLESLLGVTGPIYVPEVYALVSARNIREVMRAQKVPPSKEERPEDWHRKQFMQPIGAAVLERLLSGEGFSYASALKVSLRLLEERHILVQLDDPALNTLLAQRGWDGAIRKPGGDFLMLVDSNVGYNKTNAVVSRSLSYDVDLRDPAAPQSTLVVFHSNQSPGKDGEHCVQREKWDPEKYLTLDYIYPIQRCYYNYLRVYSPAGTQLLEASPHPVTRFDMIMLDQDVPARVDLLDEKIEGISTFGTLFFVRQGETLQTSFTFALPGEVLERVSATRNLKYSLHIQKQAGILSAPVKVRLHLPNGAQVASSSPPALQEGSDLLFELELRKDIWLEVVFTP